MPLFASDTQRLSNTLEPDGTVVKVFGCGCLAAKHFGEGLKEIMRLHLR